MAFCPPRREARKILRDELQHENGCPARRLTVQALHHGQNIITEILLIRGKTDTWITEREARVQLPISFRQKSAPINRLHLIRGPHGTRKEVRHVPQKGPCSADLRHFPVHADRLGRNEA